MGNAISIKFLSTECWQSVGVKVRIAILRCKKGREFVFGSSRCVFLQKKMQVIVDMRGQYPQKMRELSTGVDNVRKIDI